MSSENPAVAHEREDILASVDASPDASDESRFVARLLAERFSCRGFLPDPIDDAQLDRLIAIAQLAPSWCNTQPWEVVVTSGEGTTRFRDALRQHVIENPTFSDTDYPFPPRYSGIYNERRRETGLRLYKQVGVAVGDRAGSARQTFENFNLFGAPHAIIVSSDAELGTFGAIDTGIFVANLMVVAQSMGIATIAQASLAMYPVFTRKHFGMPESRKIVCGLSIGYADPTHPANSFRTNRAVPSAVITHVRS